MNILHAFCAGTKHSALLRVDFTKRPTIPSGADCILVHRAAGVGKQAFQPSQLDLRPMPAGMSYQEYKAMHPDAQFADASMLDALIHTLVGAECRLSEHMVEEYLGRFSGQIFFLGTEFADKKGNSYFAYFNWKTRYPALRYLCPAHHPVNHDVNCCACHIIPA